MNRRVLPLVFVVVTLRHASARQVPVPGCTCIENPTPREIVDGQEMTVANHANWDNTRYFEPSYGNACGFHKELGFDRCYNQSTGEPLPPEEQASWCEGSWCWVDPCTCGQPDMTKAATDFGTELWYSYRNCGEIQATVDGWGWFQDPPTCSQVFRPQDVGPCVVKVDSGTTKYECDSDSAVNGRCVKAVLGGQEYDYPSTYGEGCGIHAEPGVPECQTVPPEAWCLTPWSYINPCTCFADDVAQSTYFPNVTSFYSYAACGGTDTYTPGNVITASILASVGCPSPAPPPVSPANWPGTRGFEGVCECMEIPAEHRVACDGPIAQGVGLCANASGGLLTKNYGSMCGIHASLFNRSCYSAPADPDSMWTNVCDPPTITVGCREDFCDTAWCYVDPCTCDVADKQPSIDFPGSGLYYSYLNCAADSGAVVKPRTELCGDSGDVMAGTSLTGVSHAAVAVVMLSAVSSNS
mmetsp:Transcript_41391/g.74956  ORF Transcript_41391/g.74956 Transcript_41391/m.74956 type:complete len:468 (-) Transcript_41391:97-1500(-)